MKWTNNKIFKIILKLLFRLGTFCFESINILWHRTTQEPEQNIANSCRSAASIFQKKFSTSIRRHLHPSTSSTVARAKQKVNFFFVPLFLDIRHKKKKNAFFKAARCSVVCPSVLPQPVKCVQNSHCKLFKNHFGVVFVAPSIGRKEKPQRHIDHQKKKKRLPPKQQQQHIEPERASYAFGLSSTNFCIKKEVKINHCEVHAKCENKSFDKWLMLFFCRSGRSS